MRGAVASRVRGAISPKRPEVFHARTRHTDCVGFSPDTTPNWSSVRGVAFIWRRGRKKSRHQRRKSWADWSMYAVAT